VKGNAARQGKNCLPRSEALTGESSSEKKRSNWVDRNIKKRRLKGKRKGAQTARDEELQPRTDAAKKRAEKRKQLEKRAIYCQGRTPLEEIAGG